MVEKILRFDIREELNKRIKMNEPILRIKLDNNADFRYSFTDEEGKIINDSTYSFAKSFNDGNAFVYENYQWDVIDVNCKSVLDQLKHNYIIQIALENILPLDYFFLKNYRISENLIVSVDFLRLKRELLKLFPMKYENGGYTVAPWRDNFHWNYSQQALFIINTSKDELCFSFVEDVTLPKDGIIGIKPYDREWRYISVDDFNAHNFENKAFECDVECAYQFCDGLAKVKVNGLYGFIDVAGNLVIPAIYDDARSFSEGFAAVAIANCRKKNDDNSNYYSDLRWNFIDNSNRQILSTSKEKLTKLKEGDFYYYDSSATYNKYNCACFDDEKMNAMIPLNKYSGIIDTHSIQSHNVHWAKCEALGQLSPAYLVDLLTGQNSEELGFKRWFVLAEEKSSYAYYVLNRLFFNLPISTIDVDFDTTQLEFDYIKNINSLQIKYGETYSSGNWKSKLERTYFSTDEEFETDWTNYDDNLDMDQQSDEFWNQF